ncbi:glycosyltransferase family 2 protein [Lelliottia aquatilis]|uniref:glycosyltransferase n=1 Tax=Lelliottia aquatilis TaxID=2080838 RepID=UPI000CDE7FED|nr:glycosyltransferase [Lelliottia aquatilis]POZ19605.1 glycosyltransferase family 2 protein [Lelliottia aquatilis]
MIVDVIVATYNGEKYIKEQLTSILNQSYKDIQVLVRDDGSTDNTKKIILELQKTDSRLKFIEDELCPNGVGENFKRLFKKCTSEFVFIADQDDVWDVNKIEVLLTFAKKHFSEDLPCIAYAPGQVVDQNLKSSQNRLTNDSIKIRSLEDMILMNGGIQGCAMVVNRILYETALRNEFFWYMHDQVLSLYAVCFGKIFFYDKPLFKYRQHQSNVLGFNSNTFISRIKKYFSFNRNSFLVNQYSDELFKNFWLCEKSALSYGCKKIFTSYFSSVQNKSKFFFFVINYNVCIRKRISTSVIKMLLTKYIIEQKN